VNVRDMWMPNINPIHDQYPSWQFATPSILPTFEYPADNGKFYNFDFRYLNPAAPYASRYATQPELSAIQNYRFNNDILQYYINAAKTYYLGDLPNGVTQTEMDAVGISKGAFGVTYTYNVTLQNSSSYQRYWSYFLGFENFVGVKYTITDAATGAVISQGSHTVDANGTAADYQILGVYIPAGATYKISVSTLNGVGVAGFKHFMSVD
jgi:hypothetical protein